MPKVRKIYPQSTTQYNFSAAFNIVFLSEGYTSSQEKDFLQDCLKCITSLQEIYPFNNYKNRGDNLSFYNYFQASNNSGPALNITASTDRTVFESSLNTSTELLTLNNSKVSSVIDTLTYYDYYSEEELDLNKIDTQFDTVILNPVMYFILIPQSSSYPNGGELNYIANGSDPINLNYIASTTEGFFAQILANYLGSICGLQPEYDLDGTGYASPSSTVKKEISRSATNLLTADELDFDVQHRWKRIVTQGAVALGINPHNNSNPSVKNRTLPSVYQTSQYVELWEGGYGYRTDVYRSAEDCLMRRNIGDITLPLRKQRLGFCPICRVGMKNLLRQ